MSEGPCSIAASPPSQAAGDAAAHAALEVEKGRASHPPPCPLALLLPLRTGMTF